MPDLRSLNSTVSVQIHAYAYRGWAAFLPLTRPEAAPQLHSDTIAGRETNYLEGMRIENANVFGGELDYWRIYDLGLACTVSSYREDFVNARNGTTKKWLEISSVLVKLHSALAHARFMGQHLADVANVVVRLDWRGLSNRTLRAEEGQVGVNTPRSERFFTTVTLPWAVIRDDYATALSRLALELFAVFNLPEPYQATVRDPNFLAAEFAKVGPTFRLITDQAS